MKLDMGLSLDEAGSAADWIMQSREKEVERSKKLAEERRKQYEEELRESDDEDEDMPASKKTKKTHVSHAYAAADLKGLKVMHSTKAFEEHEEVILTLADTNILAVDEHGKVIGINEDDADLLENVNLAEDDRRDDREKRLKRSRQPVYSGYDDAEFGEGIAPGAKRSILAHYDKDQKSGPQFALGEGGVASFGEMAGSHAVALPGRVYQSLKVESKPVMSFSDVKARKASRLKDNKDKAKVTRQRVADVEEEEEEYDLTKMQAPGSTTPSAADASQPEQVNGDAMDVVETKALPPKASQRTLLRPAVDEKEEDDDLMQALARARAIAVKRNQQDAAAEGEEDKGARLALELMKSAGGEVEEQDLADTEDMDTEGRRADGSMVFNSTMEFSTRLQATLSERARVRAENAVKDMERAVDAASMAHEAPARRAKQHEREREEDGSKSAGRSVASSSNKSQEMVEGAGWEGLEEEELSVNMEEEEEEDDEDDEQLGFLHSQPLASKGMGAALALLRGSGDLKHKQELSGRAKDSRNLDPSAADYGVKLEYRDKNGLKLTQKEAFRQLSYRFHGYGPGQKKKGKKLKAMAVQAVATSSRTGILDGAAGTMKSLTTAQAATGKAHIVVQGGVHATAAQLSRMTAAAMAKKGSKQK